MVTGRRRSPGGLAYFAVSSTARLDAGVSQPGTREPRPNPAHNHDHDHDHRNWELVGNWEMGTGNHRNWELVVGTGNHRNLELVGKWEMGTGNHRNWELVGSSELGAGPDKTGECSALGFVLPFSQVRTLRICAKRMLTLPELGDALKSRCRFFFVDLP